MILIKMGSKKRAAIILINKRKPNAAPSLAWSLILEKSQESTPVLIIMPVKKTAFPDVTSAYCIAPERSGLS